MNEKDPKCKRFIRQYKDFSICVNIGEKGYVLAEHPNERYTTHYYVPYGTGRFGKIFGDKHIVFEPLKFYDVEEYVREKVIFESFEDFCLIGFNTDDKNVKWEGKVITKLESNTLIVDKQTLIINFDKPFEINQKEFKKYDYTELYPQKQYNLSVPEKYVIALFSKICQ